MAMVPYGIKYGTSLSRYLPYAARSMQAARVLRRNIPAMYKAYRFAKGAAQTGKAAYDKYQRAARGKKVSSARSKGSSVKMLTATGAHAPSQTRMWSSRSKKGRGRFKGRKRSSINKLLWKRLCTPQTVRSTFAEYGEGIQGQRAWYGLQLGGWAAINEEIVKRKPSNFLFNQNYNSTSPAQLQDFSQTNYQVTIQQFFADCRIQNRSNANMELKIYECTLRHDVTNENFSKLGTSWTTLFAGSMDLSATAGLPPGNLGPLQDSLPTGVTHNYQHPAFTPYLSNVFVSFFKILKTHSLNIGPNEVINKKFYCPKNKRLKGAYLQPNVPSLNTEWMRGYSRFILFSWVGQPVDNGTNAKQSKAHCDLIVQGNVYTKFHFWPGAEPIHNIEYGNTLIGNQTSLYQFNPADFTARIGATEIIQTVSGGEDVNVVDPS